ncbi:MAG: hypothetical protein HFH26_12615 [Clostridiaceae bacterium]|nr:hypothetical protein [Clostridiaceae bacterium]
MAQNRNGPALGWLELPLLEFVKWTKANNDIIEDRRQREEQIRNSKKVHPKLIHRNYKMT